MLVPHLAVYCTHSEPILLTRSVRFTLYPFRKEWIDQFQWRLVSLEVKCSFNVRGIGCRFISRHAGEVFVVDFKTKTPDSCLPRVIVIYNWDKQDKMYSSLTAWLDYKFTSHSYSLKIPHPKTLVGRRFNTKCSSDSSEWILLYFKEPRFYFKPVFVSII